MYKYISKYTGILRRLRISYLIFNILNLNKLKKNKSFYNEYRIKKQVWQSISHADIKKSSTEIPWMDKADVTAQIISEKAGFNDFSETVQSQILQWPENGYVIIRGLFKDEATRINEEIDNLINHGKIDFNFTRRKIMDAWKTSESINKIFNNKTILNIMHFIFDREAVPFQTINFLYGSEQKPHSDSIHMTTEPLGYLAAIWIALEDIEEGSGELVYYPGSHRLNYIMSEDYNTGNSTVALGEHNYSHYEEKISSLIIEYKLTEKKFLPKKGDVLIWHANLLHGGSKITQPGKTRKSMVAHYFAKGVLCYHEISQRPTVF